MKFFSHFCARVLVPTVLLLMSTVGVFGADLSNIVVTNNSGVPNSRVYLKVVYDNWADTCVGTSMTVPGTLATLSGLPANGPFRVRAYMDTNNDGIMSASEPRGESEAFQLTDGVLTAGSPDVSLLPASLVYAPGNPEALPVTIDELASGDGAVVMDWNLNAARDAQGAIGADNLTLEYSTDDFSTRTNKPLPLSGPAVVGGLVNGQTYKFRIRSTVGATTAYSNVVSANIAASVGGYTLSGTVDMGTFTPPANTPLLLEVWGIDTGYWSAAWYPAASNGMAFSIAGLPSDSYELYLAVDNNKDGVGGYGDYPTLAFVTVNSNVSGYSVALDDSSGVGIVNISHVMREDNSSHYDFHVRAKGGNKRLVKTHVSSSKLTDIMDMRINDEGEATACELQNAGMDPTARPGIGDAYTVTATFADGTTEDIPLQVTTVYDSPLPSGITPSGGITANPTDIGWQLPAEAFPPGWFTRVRVYGSEFYWEAVTTDGYVEFPVDTTSAPFTGPALTPGIASLAEVTFCDTDGNCVGKATLFGIKLSSPASITVPATDADGAYSVSWSSVNGASSYLLEEATNATFTTNKRTAYEGPALNANITARAVGSTYYYRVRANAIDAVSNSNWKTAAAVSVVAPALVNAPTGLTVTSGDADGAYTVTWGASSTTGAVYTLEEARDASFTSTLRVVISNTTNLSANITGRTTGNTYYYRVKATKGGYQDSNWLVNYVGCAVPGTSAVAASGTLTVPTADADGAYTVSWSASATAGVVYELQEASNSSFTTDLRMAYVGANLSQSIGGRTTNKTYYYRVRSVKAGLKDSAWRVNYVGCAVPGTTTATGPASLSVPTADADGAYSVSWSASTTAGASYELQEATNSSFSAGLRIAYTGSGLSQSISGRTIGTTYYYRVRAIKAGLKDSYWKTNLTGCAVPGTSAVAVPASLPVVPTADADGAYTVSWSASATAGVTYELQEASNGAFTADLRLAYSGTALSQGITGRSTGKTYYYRIRAVKAGFKDSSWRVNFVGCAVPGTSTVAAPASIPVVPTTDADGSYNVSWGASPTAGVVYELQEASNISFTADTRMAYTGTALNKTITGRAAGKTYYYRVRGVKPGLQDSVWQTNPSGCVVGP